MTIKELQTIIDTSNYIVFFGGAGVSTESGIKDFRSKDGLYSQKFKNYRPEDILSRSFFFNHTKDFYEYFRRHFLDTGIKPNKAHMWLKDAESIGKVKCVITQNIDGLHQMAGSKNVVELHGSAHRYYTVKKKQPIDGLTYILNTEDIPVDSEGDLIKPDVVLYEEPLNSEVVRKAIEEISKADTLIVAGTSLTVYPAASFIEYFKGKHLIVINKEYMQFKHFIEGQVGEILSQIKL